MSHQFPVPASAASPTAALEYVIEREMKLLDPHMRRDAEQVRSLLHEYFDEFAYSGTVYDRDSVLEAPQEDTIVHMTMDHVEAEMLSPDVVMLTYRSKRSDERAAWRTSLWLKVGQEWLLRHHQATIIR